MSEETKSTEALAGTPAGNTPEPTADKPPVEKTLGNTSPETAKANVPDIKVTGDPKAWRVISKASSEREGWMKSTKGLQIPRVGVLVKVTTQQRNKDGSYAIAEAVTFVPNGTLRDCPKTGCAVLAQG